VACWWENKWQLGQVVDVYFYHSRPYWYSVQFASGRQQWMECTKEDYHINWVQLKPEDCFFDASHVLGRGRRRK
jgi:hypothetical protein